MAKEYRICSVDGCDKCSAAFGYCLQHYRRFKRHGDPLGGRPWPQSRKRAEPKICKFDGCDRRSRSLGLCIKHYKRVWSKGSVEIECTEPGALKKWLLQHVGYEGGDCLDWPFGKNNEGYGVCGAGGKRTTASREMCRLAHGEPSTPDYHAAHSCGNGHLGCVNPRHLRWASAAENEADKISHGTSSRGERQGGSKLTAVDVLAIRSETGSHSEIAKRFGISRENARDIINRKRWSWLE